MKLKICQEKHLTLVKGHQSARLYLLYVRTVHLHLILYVQLYFQHIIKKCNKYKDYSSNCEEKASVSTNLSSDPLALNIIHFTAFYHGT